MQTNPALFRRFGVQSLTNFFRWSNAVCQPVKITERPAENSCQTTNVILEQMTFNNVQNK